MYFYSYNFQKSLIHNSIRYNNYNIDLLLKETYREFSWLTFVI